LAAVLQTIEMWMPRSDGALVSLTVPWKKLLEGASARTIIYQEQLELVQLYRTRGLEIVAMVDATNGLARGEEAEELVTLGRSIREPAVQALYHEYLMAVDSILHPSYLALAMETNLVRLAAPREVYDALVAMTNSTATALRASGTPAKLSVSVQVDVAWGRLQRTNQYIGIDDDLRDFDFIEALGLSAYPYLGGFAEPEDVPIDYYDRLTPSPAMPMYVIEGGWTSAAVEGVTSSPEKQARWIKRHMELADRAQLAGLFQITFTDLDLDALPLPPGSILPLFAYTGLVDASFQPKPALAEWDRAFRRPLRE
jgi:hypothetical protein